jgi:hypothetical protein
MNVCRQPFVESLLNLFSRAPAGGTQMGDLGQCVHASIGASRSAQIYLLTQKFFGSFSQFTLNRSAVFLFLPTLVTGSFVFKG